jgi:hypothetical protein
MPLSRRYTPEHPPGETCPFGLDFSMVIPPGVGITTGELSIWTNTVEPEPADSDWVAEGVIVIGRAIYCMLSGGVAGVDYQLRWVAHDTEGNVWPRTGLVLCALTS